MHRRFDSYRVTIEHDPDPDMSWLDQSMYDPQSPDYSPTYRTRADMKRDKPLDPDWYRDPANHVALWVALQGRCACCGAWETLDSLGGVDFLADSDDWQTGEFTAPRFQGLRGYLRQIARDMLREHKRAA